MPGNLATADASAFGFCVGVMIGLGLIVASVRPDWIIARSRAVLVVVAAITLLASAALVELAPLGLRLQIDPSTEPLLPRNDPGQAAYSRAVRDFGNDEVFVVAIECGEVFTVPCLTSIERATRLIAQLGRVRSVSSLLDVTSFRWVPEREWVEIRPFIEEVPHDPPLLAALRTRALADPVYRRTIVSPDSKAAAINVTFEAMSDGEFIASKLDETIREIVRDSLSPGQRFYISGRPHIKVHVYRAMVGDLVALIPLGIAAMVVALFLLTGARRNVVIPIANSLVAIVWVFAAMVATGHSLSILTGLLAPMLLAIGSVYGIHAISRYEEEAARCSDPKTAVEAALRQLVVPVIIAGVTTDAGFAALLVSDVPAVRELGWFSMLGVSSITVLTLTAVPALLVGMPLRGRAGAGGVPSQGRHRAAEALNRSLETGLAALAGFVSRKSGPIVVVAVLLGLLAVAAIPHIVIDTDYLSYFDERDPVRRDFEAVNRLLAGAIPIYVALDAPEPGGFRQPEVLALVEDLQQRVAKIPGVSHTLSSLDTLRRLNRAFAADDPQAERIPETRGAVSELLFMMPKADGSQFMTINHGRANLIVRTGEVGSAAIARLASQLESAVSATPWPQGFGWSVTGNTILLSRSADGIARSQPLSVCLAAAAIFVLVAGGLRSLTLGAIAMVPNLLPVLLFFGLLGAGAAPLSLPTSLIGCIALGVAIDDSVHYLVRYRKERERGADPTRAVAICGSQIGRPIALTSLVIALGFLAVVFSEFASLREFGFLSAATMAICLCTDLVLLPALLIRAKV